jgi:hypothetical protein
MGALGTDKELEKLARQVRRAGGSVKVTKSNHLIWELNGRIVRTGLTMHPSSVRQTLKRVEKGLGLRTE